ncbi:hypothetical protein F5X96DRAFT_683130 [Biscogniauxia mediterranea]|nr:hypothetical protein F5X96DRAFT_683130 [Biscogniauxia mediterranea]
MHLSKAMLGLPPSLLLLLAMQLGGGSASAAQGQAIQQQQQKRSLLPTAIKKMSLDEGEKFMPEYYAFAPEPSFAEATQSSPDASTFWARSLALLTPEEEALLALNSSATIHYRPPFPRHYDYRRAAVGVGADADVSSGGRRRFLYRRARDALARLQGRQFSCPDNTASCDNIDQPNYCCVEGTTCFVVTDSPEAGNVGCCPEGQNCGGSVGTCTDDSTACPADVGGGCCVSGFVCAEVGCVASSVSVITSTTVTSTVVTSPTPTTQVITVVVTVTPSATPATSTVTRTTTAGDSTGTITTTTTTGAGIPPVRPTSSGSSSSQTSSSSPTITTSSSGYCPTGFYACLASAGAGCCRTGRDCSTTSCPPPPPMTTYTANGVTVAVPAGDASAASAAGPDAAPTCAGGWFMCGADAGPVPGCCPDGYVCGTASCTLSAAAETATVQKEMPGGAGAAAGMGMGRMLGGGLVGWGLVWGWQGGLLLG